MSDALHIALIGAGHMGGSFALALKEAHSHVSITAYDADGDQAALLQSRGGADRVAESVADAVRGADVVMLATPLRTYRALASEIAPYLGKHSIVTDLGSVKGSMEAIAPLLGTTRVVPGHPIAGGEKTGAAVARADLFNNRLCILTSGVDALDAPTDTIGTLWHITGADVLRMPANVHDSIYAYVSHLPHLIAFVAAELLYQDGVRVADDAHVLHQFLRISRSSPRMWSDIFLENREALLSALSTYIALLEHFVTELSSGKDAPHAVENVAERFVPRILASCLISCVSLYEQQSAMSLRPFGAGGMRDIVAPAAIDPEAGELEAISKAAPLVAEALKRVLPLLREIESLIGAEDEAGLFDRLSQMVSHAHALVSQRQ